MRYRVRALAIGGPCAAALAAHAQGRACLKCLIDVKNSREPLDLYGHAKAHVLGSLDSKQTTRPGTAYRSGASTSLRASTMRRLAGTGPSQGRRGALGLVDRHACRCDFVADDACSPIGVAFCFGPAPLRLGDMHQDPRLVD